MGTAGRALLAVGILASTGLVACSTDSEATTWGPAQGVSVRMSNLQRCDVGESVAPSWAERGPNRGAKFDVEIASTSQYPVRVDALRSVEVSIDNVESLHLQDHGERDNGKPGDCANTYNDAPRGKKIQPGEPWTFSWAGSAPEQPGALRLTMTVELRVGFQGQIGDGNADS